MFNELVGDPVILSKPQALLFSRVMAISFTSSFVNLLSNQLLGFWSIESELGVLGSIGLGFEA